MKMFSKKVLVVGLTLMMIFSFAACGGNNEPAAEDGDGSLQRVLDAGKLSVGAEGNWEPYVFHNSDGELDGFEVAMAKEIAQKPGVELDMASNISDSWDGVLAGLDASRYDAVICGCSPNPDRKPMSALSHMANS